MTSTVPPGRSRFTSIPEALRAWLLSACPSGTKAIQFLTSPRDDLWVYPWAEWHEDKDILGRVSRFSEEGEASSLSFLSVRVLCPAGATKLSPGIYPWELPRRDAS